MLLVMESDSRHEVKFGVYSLSDWLSGAEALTLDC